MPQIRHLRAWIRPLQAIIMSQMGRGTNRQKDGWKDKQEISPFPLWSRRLNPLPGCSPKGYLRIPRAIWGSQKLTWGSQEPTQRSPKTTLTSNVPTFGSQVLTLGSKKPTWETKKPIWGVQKARLLICEWYLFHLCAWSLIGHGKNKGLGEQQEI